MLRRPVVVGNWKMNTTLPEAVVLAGAVAHAAERIDDVDIVLMPPAIWLPTLHESLHHRPRSIRFGVQNFYPENHGAYTGELGIDMLKGFADYALIGHSERRTLLHESNELINDKIHTALRNDLHPVLCVGELTQVMLKSRSRGRPTVLERESDVLRQLRQALRGVRERHVERLLVCYEPLWAIGTGENVPGAHVAAILEQFRAELTSLFGAPIAQRIRLLYGGSVNEHNVHEYLRQPEIDGLLVGGASLDAKQFIAIVREAATRAERAGRGYDATHV